MSIHADLKTPELANPVMPRRVPMNGYATFVKNPESNARTAQIAGSFWLRTKLSAGICRVEMQWDGVL